MINASWKKPIIPVFSDTPPERHKVSDYDRRHFELYLNLIDNADRGMDWKTSFQNSFGSDPNGDPDKSWIIFQSHLKRARWMSTTGYRLILKSEEY